MRKTIITGFCDYELDSDRCRDPYTNAELKISLRLEFRQVNPPAGTVSGTYHDYGDASKQARRIVPWTPSAWAAWVKRFAWWATSFWNKRFWLINNYPDLDFQVGKAKYRPNIDCTFELVAEHAGSRNRHYTVDVVKLAPTESWFGSNSTLLDNLDMKPDFSGNEIDGKKAPIWGLAGVHEIGHLLGFDHVNVGKPQCPKGGNTNASMCYGVSDSERSSLMGGGMALRDEHANPWRRGMIEALGQGSLNTPNDWPAMRIRTWPRTLDEAASNKRITSLPLR